MKRYAFATAVLLIVVFPWRQAPQADTPTYTVEALGDLGNIGNLVPVETGINASGEIVGTLTDNTRQGPLNTRAVRYTDGIGWEYVPGLDWGSQAAGINVYGDIVGTRLVGTASHAYRYSATSGVVDDILPLAGGANSFGQGINDNGDVVGQSDAPGASRAFVAQVGQAAVQLPSLGGTNDDACGINNLGQIAETSYDSTGMPFAARVEADHQTILNAGTVDGTFGMSSACAIDDLGHIGGFSSSNSLAAFHAFRWNPGNPVVADAGLPSTFGNIVSISAGVSAGWYQLADGSGVHALMHTDANGAVDVNTLLPANSGWVLYQVTGINGSGQMVGDGLFNGVPTVFRFSPSKPKDTTPPVIAPHADVTAEATGPTGAIVTYTAPSTTDNVDPPGTATCAPASGSLFALGTTTVTCTATDAAGNVATPTTFNVIVKDTTPPVIAPHADVTAEATGPTGASVTYTVPSTTDLVDGTGTATCAPASGSTFALGTTTVTCKATDAAGNAATPTMFNVVVKDTTAPVIAAHADVAAEATGPSGASVTYTAPATTDAVDGTRTASCAPVSGSTFPLGTTTVTCNATDAAGNVATPTTFRVVVGDTTPPVISMVYASPNAIWPPNGKFVPVSVMVTVTDLVDPAPTCALTSITGGTPGGAAITGPLSASVRADSGAVYTLTVTCSDFSGNASSASATVTVGKTNGAVGTPKARLP